MTIREVENYKPLFFPEPSKGNDPIITSSEPGNLISSSNHALEADFETARNSIQEALETSNSVLENLVEILKQTDSARAGEVAANLIGTISSVAKDLIEIHEKYNRLKTKPENSITQQTNIQNNILFKGSSKELLDMIKNTN